MKRLHLFLLISCLILVIVYFGIKSTREPFAQCGVNDACTTKYSVSSSMWGMNVWRVKECPNECPICMFTPSDGGPPMNLDKDPNSQNSNNQDESKRGKCIPDSLAPTNLINIVAPVIPGTHLTFTDPVDMIHLENTIAQIATFRILAPDGTWFGLGAAGVEAGPEQRLSDVNFLGYYLLLMQGMQQGQNLIQNIIDEYFGGRTLALRSPSNSNAMSDTQNNPPGILANILQTRQANIDPTQQVEVNFPGVLGDTVMLPLIPTVSPKYGLTRTVDPGVLNMFQPSRYSFPTAPSPEHRIAYETQIQPAINELLQALTPGTIPYTARLQLGAAQTKLAFTIGNNPRLGKGSSINTLAPDLVQMIGDRLQRMRVLPRLVHQQGIFRIIFNYNGQRTDLQTVIRQALYGTTTTGGVMIARQRMSIVLWIVGQFVLLSQFCSVSINPFDNWDPFDDSDSPPPPPPSSDSDSDDGSGTGLGRPDLRRLTV